MDPFDTFGTRVSCTTSTKASTKHRGGKREERAERNSGRDLGLKCGLLASAVFKKPL